MSTLTRTDCERVTLARGAASLEHLRRGARSPLGTDHPTLVRYRRAEARANSAAAQHLALGVQAGGLVRDAHSLSAAGDWDTARSVLQTARACREQEQIAADRYRAGAEQHLRELRAVVALVARRETQRAAQAVHQVIAEHQLRAVTLEAQQVSEQRSDSTPAAAGLELAAHQSANAPGQAGDTDLHLQITYTGQGVT